MPDAPHVIDTETAARILGVSVQQMIAWRQSGKGPPTVKHGWRPRYEITALRAWLRRQRQPASA